jgi:hypothetical protein
MSCSVSRHSRTSGVMMSSLVQRCVTVDEQGHTNTLPTVEAVFLSIPTEPTFDARSSRRPHVPPGRRDGVEVPVEGRFDEVGQEDAVGWGQIWLPARRWCRPDVLLY